MQWKIAELKLYFMQSEIAKQTFLNQDLLLFSLVIDYL